MASERDRPRSWVSHGRYDVHWLANGTLVLGVVPSLGGRLLSMRVDGRELLWRNPNLLTDELQPVPGHVPAPGAGSLGDWRNYGGDKTWPAPQGWSSPTEWAGPPDPVLDSGRYGVDVIETSESTVLTVTSAADPRTGLQLAGGGSVEIAVDDAFTDPVALAIGTGVPSWRRTARGIVEIGPQDVVGKLGFPHAAGRMSYRRDDVCLSWQFDVDDEASYPDGGSRAEVWMEHPQPAPLASLDGLDPPDRIVECEVLSPSRRSSATTP